MINLVSENMNQLSKMFDTIQKDRSLQLNENIEFLKNKLRSKDEMIKSLIETQTLVLETVKNSKANPTITQDEIGKNRKSVEENPNKHKNFGKKTLIVKNLAQSVILEDITELSGLNSTKYLGENCSIELPLNLKETNNQGYAYVTAPNHIADELVKLNNIGLRGHNLIIEEVAAKPKTLNSNTICFTSPNRYAVLVPNQEEKEDNFEITGTSNFDISKNVRNHINKRNSINNSKSPKRRSQVVVNKHPENQTSFGKSNVKPGRKTYNEVIKLNKEEGNILIFSESIPGKMRMYEFNKVLKNGNIKHLFFPGATSEQVSQYLDVNLQMYAPKTVIIHVGINDLLNDSGHLNMENILNNFKAMTKKCRNYNVRNFLLSELVYTKRVELSVLHLKLVELCSQYGVIYIDNRNIFGMNLYQDNLDLLHSGKRILLNNFISNLHFLTETQVCNTFT